MEEKIAFERFLYEDENEIKVHDIEFCVDRIIMLPKIRPHQLEKAVSLSVEYCSNADFRRRMLEKSVKYPVLIYRLYKLGIFDFEEIEPFLRNRETFLLCYYFRKKISDFESFIKNKDMPSRFKQGFFEYQNDIDTLIEYGFHPSSIEYCLKYDVIDDFVYFDIMNAEVQWSPFEWSIMPKYLDLLSISGFFGSIKCFKHLLMEGFDINNKVISMIVCGGCLDLFQLCQRHQCFSIENFCYASEFFHLPLLTYMLENGVNVNSKGFNYDFLSKIILLFIMLLQMVIFVLLSF